MATQGILGHITPLPVTLLRSFRRGATLSARQFRALAMSHVRRSPCSTPLRSPRPRRAGSPTHTPLPSTGFHHALPTGPTRPLRASTAPGTSHSPRATASRCSPPPTPSTRGRSIACPCRPRSKQRACGRRPTSTSRCRGMGTATHRPPRFLGTAAWPSTGASSRSTPDSRRPSALKEASACASRASRRRYTSGSTARSSATARTATRQASSMSRRRYRAGIRAHKRIASWSRATSTRVPPGLRGRTHGASTGCSAPSPWWPCPHATLRTWRRAPTTIAMLARVFSR